jgi:hypothetical protein
MPADTHSVALIIFNRPAVTKIVFERIRQARPGMLMLIADGPRENCAGESEACQQVRQIVERVDWPCEVLKNYSDTNLGCGARVASGLDWVFEQVEQAIILEDDCLPDPTFFRFCCELLERYRDDRRVMQICGSNFLFGRRVSCDSYHFSRYPHCWGWATWRRAWRYFDFSIEAWKTNPQACLANFGHRGERAFWCDQWERIAQGLLDTWDSQWSLAVLNANGLAAMPAVNLVSNVGFGLDATHTHSRLLAMRPAVGEIVFSLRHPERMEASRAADEFTARRFYYQRSRAGKAGEIVKRRVLSALSHIRAVRGAQTQVGAIPASSVSPE